MTPAPLEQTLSDSWQRIDRSYRTAFFVVVVINLLAFGFEMTNLTLHHDDVSQILIQDTILGHYIGRFGLGWLHYYTQSAYFMPFLQMLEGVVLMTAYGLVIAHLWGLRRSLDIVLVAAITCVFPLMAQIFQYNTAMATYPLAHLLSAMAVLFSVRATLKHTVAAALLYTAAFSIYQSVIANAATLFGIWALTRILFEEGQGGFFTRGMVKSAVAALLAVSTGGLIYIGAVSLIDIPFDSYQRAGTAFSLGNGLDVRYALSEVLNGSRRFYFWPENYFPNYLKVLQLIFIALAAILCLWLPKGLSGKSAAATILLLTLFAPRLLQLLHAEGHFHSLTLTAYAIVIAGCVMICSRAAPVTARNLSVVLASFLVAGYILQCNAISTVNYLNTQAHYATLTQILARLRSLPPMGWDGRKAVVLGSYKLYPGYPYQKSTGVATDFIDAKHMQELARLLRDEIIFMPEAQATPGALKFAEGRPPWPHPDSVGVVNGIAVIVLSADRADTGAKQPQGG